MSHKQPSIDYLRILRKHDRLRKQEQRMSEQISSVLEKPGDLPLWSNERYWQEQWPKLVDAYTSEVEANSKAFQKDMAEHNIRWDEWKHTI